MIILLALGTAMAGNDVRNPGGERIPFVKLRSEVWDVVIRKTADDRARIERVKAQCQGIWVNACAPGVDPELRQLALKSVFQESVALSGDFTYCSTAVLRELPEDLGRKLIRPDTDGFCQIFLDPESVRGLRTGNATQGENDLVGRLMGGQNTTSGKVLIKAPPTLEGSGSEQVYEATGERRKPGIAATTPRPAPTPQPTGMPAPMPASAPVATAPQTAPVATAPVQPEPTGMDFPEHQSKGEFDDFVMPEPSFSRPEPAPQTDLFEGTSDMPDTPVFVPPEPAPAPEPIDDELAELLAPIPTIESKPALGNGMTGSPTPAPAPAPAPAPEPRFTPPPPEPKGPMASNAPAPQPRMDAAAVAVPAPKPEPVAPPKPAPPPKPTGPSEFELEAMEMANMEPLTAKNEDDKKKKKKGKGEEPAETLGGDEEFDNYIIIDIESLSDE
ncbi:MAG: hypothetical protein H6737_18960 [Alphaproteobacteria bacterium]|nr:hypothetical protein [Alphaproteobacteria bacterium]